MDRTPLTRPQSFASIHGTDVRSTLDRIVAVLDKSGYKITQLTPGRGELAATRIEAGGEDRVLIWLEWDLDRQQDLFSVYMTAGRYEKFFGNTEYQRVALSPSATDSRFASLRQAIRELR